MKTNDINKPNIIFLMTDQHRWDGIGILNSKIKTPTLDRLAEDGILYTNAVCNSPMCVSSRYSMMIGLYPSQCGVRHNTQMCPTDQDMVIDTMAERMYKNGYQTVGIGKTHWYISQPEKRKTEVNTSKRGFEIRIERSRGNNPDRDEPDTEFMGNELPEVFKALGKESRNYRRGGENAEGYIGCTSAVPANLQKEGWLTDKAIEFLEDRRDLDRPFFLYLSFDFPHAGLNVPEGYEDMYDISQIEVPELAVKETQLTDHYIQPKNVAEWKRWREEFSLEDKKRTILRYYALCTYVDDMFGRLIRKLEKINELENTVIVFCSDHGDMLGERNRFSKYSLYEGSIRIPLIVSGPCIEKDLKGTKDNRPAELVDIIPTFNHIIGVEQDERLVGYSLLDKPKRMGSFSELHGSGYQEIERPPAYMWRKKEWKLILFMPGYFENLDMKLNNVTGELYHIKKDPLELNNLYDNKKYLEMREQMTRELLIHLAISWSRFPRHYSYTKLK